MDGFKTQNRDLEKHYREFKDNRITILTVGSRGDVQPFVALGIELQKLGNIVRIATHEIFRSFIESHNLEFYPLRGDPTELIQLCVNNNIMTLNFVQEGMSKFSAFIDNLLEDCLQACLNTDIIIATPSSMAGYHIAEMLQIPFFSAFTMPLTRTSNFPCVFSGPGYFQNNVYNYISHVLTEEVLWVPIMGKINEWRSNKLGLPPCNFLSGPQSLIHESNVPTLYCFSSYVCPRPSDWPDNVQITGYWFLDSVDSSFSKDSKNHKEQSENLSSESKNPINNIATVPHNSVTSWSPPEDLIRFLSVDAPIIYIGFGSMIIPDIEAMSQLIADSVNYYGHRAIVCSGWGKLCANISDPNIYVCDNIPHSWLFDHVAAVCHHGGAGTIAAGLRAGKPTLVISFFGDQRFWGEKIEEMGIGKTIPHYQVTKKWLGTAIHNILTCESYTSSAKYIGKKIQEEDGIKNATDFIVSNWSRAYIPHVPVPDDKSSKCMVASCRKMFSFMNRRHHCRFCGLLVCEQCSQYRITIPKYRYFTPVRVCSNCFSKQKVPFD